MRTVKLRTLLIPSPAQAVERVRKCLVVIGGECEERVQQGDEDDREHRQRHVGGVEWEGSSVDERMARQVN